VSFRFKWNDDDMIETDSELIGLLQLTACRFAMVSIHTAMAVQNAAAAACCFIGLVLAQKLFLGVYLQDSHPWTYVPLA